MTEHVTHADFPADETLAAFIDGRLDPETRRRVMEHVATCAECYDVVLAANALREPATNVIPIRRSRWLVPGLAAAAVLALVALFVSPLRDRILPQPKGGLAALAAAAPPQRTIEGRLTGFPYRPLKPVTRGGAEDEDTSPEHLKLLSVAAQIAADAKERPTPESLHAYGASLLMVGNTDAAVSTLEDALRKETGEDDIDLAVQRSSDAGLLNDLSAARYARAQSPDHTRDLLLAVAAAERAFRIEGKSADIAWNRALAIEALHVRANAIDAWNDYLHIDPRSPWADEARRRLVSLQQTSAIATPNRSADALYDDVLGSWAAKIQAGDVAAAHDSLHEARTIAASLCAAGNCVGADSVAAIEKAQQQNDAARLALLVRGHADYAEGRRRYRAREATVAADVLSRATRTLAMAATPFHFVAELSLISAIYLQNDYAAVRSRSTTLAQHLPDRYGSLRGRLEWIDGIMEMEQGRPFEAFRDFDSARSRFSTTGDHSGESVMWSFAAQALRYMGEQDRAWTYRLHALAAEASATPVNRHYILSEAVLASYDDCPAAGRLFVDRMIAADSTSLTPVEVTSGFVWRALLRNRIRDRTGALQDISRARSLCNTIRDQHVQERAISNVDFADAVLCTAGQSQSASELTHAIGYATKTGSNFRTALLYLRRAAEMLASGDRAAAGKDVDVGMRLLETQRRSIPDAMLKASFLDAVRPALQGVMSQFVLRGEPARALEQVERFRARILGNDTGETLPTQPLQSLQAALGARTLFVEQFMTDDQLTSWVVDRHSVHVLRTPIDARNVRAAVRRFCAAVAAGQATPEDEQLLRSVVFDPLRSLIGNATTIVFSPDEALANVPYGAIHLWDGQYALEHLAISFAPSARVFSAMAAASATRESTTHALIIANPLTRSGPVLPGSAIEASALSRVYGNASILTGDEASRDAFIERLQSANIVHFAGHTVVNDQRPELSAIVIASENGADRLYAHDIAKLHLTHTRLAVLASCESATAPAQHAGISRIADAFIAAGVPQVIGTLWPIDDGSVSIFTRELHRRIAGGVAPSAALRATQQWMMQRIPGSSRIWAAFVLIGGPDRQKEG